MATKGLTGAKLGCVANKGLSRNCEGLSELEVKRSRAEGAGFAETEVVDFGERRSGLEDELWV